MATLGTRPVLTAGPLRLTPFAETHLSEAYVAWLKDPQVMRFSEQRHRHHDMASCRAYAAAMAAGPGQLWAIERKEDALHVGNLSASIDPNNGLADIGILIGHAAARGQGYGRRAWQAALTHLAARPDLRKVTGGCMASNHAMVRIMQGAGMQEDGRRRAHFVVDGKPMDIVHYAIWTDGTASLIKT